MDWSAASPLCPDHLGQLDLDERHGAGEFRSVVGLIDDSVALLGVVDHTVAADRELLVGGRRNAGMEGESCLPREVCELW